jgi:hypothetical protein
LLIPAAIGLRSYLTPDNGMTYPEMPYPLNEIYEKLRYISVNDTEEVYRQSIKG